MEKGWIMDKTLGELIQEALVEKGWSNAELARRAGFSSTHIGNLIRDYSPGTKSGKPTRLPTDTIDRIAKALGGDRALFRRAAGLLPEGATLEEVSTSESDRAAEAARTVEMIENWTTMTPEEQSAALAFLKFIKAEHPDALKILGPKFKVKDSSDLTQPDIEEISSPQDR
jgi:transcriptional regulator with XRE-family HTH domain